MESAAAALMLCAGGDAVLDGGGIGDGDPDALARRYLRLRFNAFPVAHGLAVFPTAAALNHSCAPGAAVATDCHVLGEVLRGGGWAEFRFLDASNQYRVFSKDIIKLAMGV